ncbi:MAG: 50S ribosomal protein L15 [Candidatus Methylacidiphilales bacterium]
MQLHQIKPRPGAKHSRKRLGCGESSGHGKTSGKGNKGQKARSGGSIREGFEGGQLPIYRRLPKRGFNNKRFKNFLAPVNVGSLNVFDHGTVVDAATLKASGLVGGNWDGIKILARGDLSKKLTIKVDAASEAAIEKINSAGGSFEPSAS